jgi:hypothetical protein
LAGLAAPWVAANVRLPELTFNVVGGAARFNVTFTVRVRPPPETVIVPLFVPTIAVVGSTATVTGPLFTPLAGLTLSQLTDSLTLHETLEVIDND